MKKNYYLLASILALTFKFSSAQPTQPPSPIACNSSNCTAPISETCSGGSNVVTNFTGATLRSGSPTSLPAVYSFYNIAMISGQQINATITIDAQSNCSMVSGDFAIDDDAATDQDGNSIASFFAPRIRPCNNLTNSDLRGYVQFTIRFYMENGTAGQQYPGDYTTVPPLGGLSGLNYIHYDIDGTDVGSGGWFRETGVVKNTAGLNINANVPTELVSYMYNDGGTWKGFAGSVCERTGVSRCSQVAVAANFSTPQTQVTFRMGYDYNYNGTDFDSQPTRQYGSRFGCFAFPQQGTLPVKLLSFTGTYKNESTLLNWSAENQINFSAYDVERSSNGFDYSSIATKVPQGSGSDRQQYQYTDDLSSAGGDVFYYRLRMIDIDGHFAYSNVIMIRKDPRKMGGIGISPNPIISSGMANLRMTAVKGGNVEIRVIDMSGDVVLHQQSQVTEGNNSISIMNLNRLQPGVYMLKVSNGEIIESVKFSVIR